jgi:hypothetical protein
MRVRQLEAALSGDVSLWSILLCEPEPSVPVIRTPALSRDGTRETTEGLISGPTMLPRRERVNSFNCDVWVGKSGI